MCALSQGVETMAGFPNVRMARSPLVKDRDVREIPLYSMSEVALFLGIPATTLGYWIRPHNYKRLGTVEPFIVPAGSSTDMATGKDVAWLSFYNLSEAHILSAITRFHGVKMPRVREAIESIKRLKLSNTTHPLLSHEFLTDGRDLFVKTIDRRHQLTIDLSQYGQLGLTEVLDLYLKKVIRDDEHNPIKLFPEKQISNVVSIVPTISSGRPIVDGKGIPVASLWNRYKSGDSIDFLAEDYELSLDQVKGALDYCEQRAA